MQADLTFRGMEPTDAIEDFVKKNIVKFKKYLGKEASAYLEEELMFENIIIKTEKDGKYGRMLGWLYKEGEDISIQERMINKGYGWAYDGGTKEKSYEELRQKRIADGSWTYGSDHEDVGYQGE